MLIFLGSLVNSANVTFNPHLNCEICVTHVMNNDALSHEDQSLDDQQTVAKKEVF